MQTLHFSIIINAPRSEVYEKMLADKTYREWTKAFSPTSYYEGSWEMGKPIRFLDGSGSGMVSEIAENRVNEFLSIRHLGWIENGREDTTSDKIKAWAPSYENYTFADKDGGTEVIVDMDATDEFAAMFTDLWPHALDRLKKVVEGTLPEQITVETTVNVSAEKAWEYWTKPEHITGWAFAEDTWEAPVAENDVKAGGRFRTRIQAKDGSNGFDFTGSYTMVRENKFMAYRLDDGRLVSVTFTPVGSGTHITETFEAEGTNPIEMQRSGWQAFMNNFKTYAERQSA